MPKHVAPAITSKSFSCPHCGAHSDQTWFEAYADPVGKDQRTPLLMTAEKLEEVKKDIGQHLDPEPARELIKRFMREAAGEPFLLRLDNSVYIGRRLENIHLSSCYTCGEISIWRHDTILYPPLRYDVEPNPDLDEDTRHAEYSTFRREARPRCCASAYKKSASSLACLAPI
jgi:predicted RNA-binding Zn-ribbon protein involved in translation (DUF1610 family)